MAGKRLLFIAIATLLLNGLWLGSAHAGFLGFGSNESGKSGLDFTRGYDLNTVGIVTGRVASLPHQVENEQYLFELQVDSSTVKVSVGPGSFWNRSGIALRINDEVSAKGARAQGQDGKTYLLTQKLVNRTTGTTLELRSEGGEPVWSGKTNLGPGMRLQGGQRFQGSGFMRGGGMMGGGMMRR